ncbi:dynein light chain Tctex-type 5 [Perognathus longimembris pacificus]|uniref:dynein light chain Tctex-type 5 n=1 Tax=Perognathus longimembris pacificus TaxID=214514 RepID=UPI00201875CC|nr:dynein light chain Tctex-type 5 [Perognathus longimembris pacificus]
MESHEILSQNWLSTKILPSHLHKLLGLQNTMMTNPMKDIAAHSLKKSGSLSSLSSHEFRRKGIHGRIKDSVSTVSYMDEPSQREEVSRLTVQMENTYQLGPTKHFPVVTVNHILKDVLTNYLQEENYEPELCRQMTKTIAEVIKARVKELMIPRYKLVVIIHIGQLDGQSLLIGNRCLWDPKRDTVSSYVFRNTSLFALANVYAIYLE